MPLTIQPRITQRNAGTIASGYFLLLGIVNLVSSAIWSEIRAIDFILAVICILPLLVRKKMFHVVYGILAACIAAYCLFACLLYSLDPKSQTTAGSFLMGFLLTGSGIVASVLLVFAGSSASRSARLMTGNS